MSVNLDINDSDDESIQIGISNEIIDIENHDNDTDYIIKDDLTLHNTINENKKTTVEYLNR